ncbi:hypothetical protein Tco_0642606 [Tanacetum coccineum]
MSSSTSTVTYTSVYTDFEPGRAFWGADDEGVSEANIPRIIVLGYDGLPLQPVAPPSPDYVPGPENPQTPPVPQDGDEHEFLAEEQPLPGHVTESDPEEDLEGYEDDETEDGLADLTTVIPVDELYFPPEGTEPVIPPPSTDITIGARITVRPQTSISLPPEAEVERLLTMTTPSPSPPISLSPPSVGERLARYEIGESSTARPTRGRGIDYGFVSTVDAEERRQGIRDVGYGIRDTWVDPAEADLYALLEADRETGFWMVGGRKPMLPERLWASLDRIVSATAARVLSFRTQGISTRIVPDAADELAALREN